jgi:prepilin-type N-terminal cleavage/methylation domain-containing protein
MNSKKAFTLIELLVVIAIIAILAAILFPVFAQAKAAAKKTQTLSNAKQATLGIMMYMNDVDDVYPAGCGCSWYYPNGDGGWEWDTQPYIKNLPILRDAIDPLAGIYLPTWAPPTGVNTSMVSNGFMAWNNSTSAWEVFGIAGMNQGKATNVGNPNCGGAWMGKTITTVNDVTQPANSIALSTRIGGDDLFGQGDMVSGVNWWDYTGAGLIPDGSAPNTPYYAPTTAGGSYEVTTNEQTGAVAIQGGNVSIFTFCDGHAKAMNPLATDPNSSTQPQNNLWNVRR